MLSIQVTGQEQVIASLSGLPARVFSEIRGEVDRLSIALLIMVKNEKLSGQVLKNRTGTLRRKINRELQAGADQVTATVGVKLSYAAAHEYGFNGTVSVKQHLRKIKQAWGRPIKPTTALVAQHSRHMRLPERSYLRSALREMSDQIQMGLEAAVRRAVEKA